MGAADLAYVIFAVGVFHATVTGVYCYGAWRDAPDRQTPRVHALARYTVTISVGLLIAYLSAALLALQYLPVGIGYPVFVAAWPIYGVLLGGLFALSLVRAYRLRESNSRPTEPGAAQVSSR